MADLGLTHIALPVTDLDASIAFYRKYARMSVIHHRVDHPGQAVAWITDHTRPFIIVLIQQPTVEHPLLSPAHLGFACETREEVDHLCAQAKAEGQLKDGPTDSGPPVGYWAFLKDPNGHILELSYGQEVAFTVEHIQEISR
ncbi:MAG: VOC family protein [Kovacikia sp.]